MIVHHTSTEGEKAIMSVFIINGDESTANLTSENPNRFHELYQEIF
jgi:GTP cyclohydrolase I